MSWYDQIFLLHVKCNLSLLGNSKLYVLIHILLDTMLRL